MVSIFRPVFGVWVIVSAVAPVSAADCDCRRRVGLCQAEGHFDGSRIAFTSQTNECSRISFSLLDHEAAITIRRGAGSVAFAAPGAAPGSVAIEACYVCDLADD